jgi:hypothetical protein
MKRIYVFPFSVFLFSVSAYAGPSVLEQGLVVSNGLTVASGPLLVRDGTNLVPVLKQGDVPSTPPRVDGFTVLTDSVGRISLPARFDLNDALFAWRLSLLEGSFFGMVDGWFWSPVSTAGLSEHEPGRFIEAVGIANYQQSPTRALDFEYGRTFGYTRTNMPLSGGNYTIQAWVRKNSALGGGFFAAGVGSWNGPMQGIALVGYNEVWQLSQWDVSVWYAGSHKVDQWVHMVGVISNSIHATLYLDGVPVASCEDCFDADETLPAPLYVGRAPDGWGWFDGRIDDVVFWNRALSEDEVRDLYNEGFGVLLDTEHPLAAGVAGIWPFEDETGNDIGGAGNDLELENYKWAEGVVRRLDYVFDTDVVSESMSVDFEPEAFRGILAVEGFLGPVAATSAWLHASRDGGATWTDIGLLPAPLGPAGRMQVFTGLGSFTNQPPGTQVVFKVALPEATPITLRGFGGNWR